MKNKILLAFAWLLIASWAYADKVTTPEKGQDYFFDLTDGSIVPTDTDGKSNIDYGIFRILVGTQNAYGYNGAQHGSIFKQGNIIEIDVAGDVNLQIAGCGYSKGQVSVSDASGASLGTKESKTEKCYHEDNSNILEFSYSGAATTLKIAFEKAETYVPNIAVKAVITEESNGLTDVWDFGADQLDDTKYNNQLTVELINGWYDPAIEVGSSGNNFPSGFTAGILSWTGGSNDRLRTANTNLTRYDDKQAVTIEGETLNGYLYVNGAAQVGRFLSLNLNEDDEVLRYCNSQNGNGKLNFVYTNDPDKQTDFASASSNGSLVKFVAKFKGTYKIFDSEDKPSYFRVLRKPVVYAKVHGPVQSDIALPEGYGVQFTNEAGKTWDATVNNGNYEVKLPMGYTYKISLSNANGYIIDNVTTVEVNAEDLSHDVHVTKLELYTVTGNITGLDAVIGKLALVYTPATTKIYVPEPSVDFTNKTYTVQLEPNCEYTISAEGVNDYQLTDDKITITGDMSKDILFQAKPTYTVTLNAEGLASEQTAKMSVTFTNLNEEGYSYSFASLSDIKLRDGVYSVAVSGLDEYPLQQALTSNLKVEGRAVEKSIAFKPVSVWSFDDQVIANGATAYKGLAFTGSIKNEIAKGHLLAPSGATIAVPVEKGSKVTITYYYAANFTINGGEEIKTTTSAGSTSKFESVEYTYTGEGSGVVTLAFGDAYSKADGSGSVQPTYLTEIRVSKVIPYTETIYVGTDKECTTINAALETVRCMTRPNNERVKIMIEPRNYEEMLVVDIPNVSLINAAVKPSIALKNKGVDIDESAVRITSYYGHGYSYYSMAGNQQWNEETLKVNKENGYLSYVNTGSGTTNNSYWNATVVVSADGFEAENIIFENSYNQYISKKESEDVVVEWVTGGKGTRPTQVGSTAVQDKSFVERAAAIAIANNTDKVILNKCRVVGRQDSFYGGTNVRAAIYKGVMMGGTDYIFGGMTAVFYKSELAMNTSENNNDVSYITAAQQSSGRGYLMYECKVTSAEPEIETASAYRSKPGYFGRPWQANTAEVVFYNTTIGTSNHPDYNGQSLIKPEGWNNSLGGTSPLCYEYGTIEETEDAASARADWSTVLTEPVLSDGTAITTLNFTKGNDSWDPIPALIEQDDATGICKQVLSDNSLIISTDGVNVYVNGVRGQAIISVYGMDGALVKTLRVDEDARLQLGAGFWIVKAGNEEGIKSAKVVIR